jgi:hypothetical protein
MTKRMLPFATGAIVGAFGAYLFAPAFGISSGPFSTVQSGDSTVARWATDRGPAQSDVTNGARTPPGSNALAELDRRLESDPVAALREAMQGRDPAAQRRDVMLIGVRWARIDPEAALRSASTLPETLQADFRASVSSEWANLDADGFLNFARQTTDLEALSEGLTLLIASDPAQVYEIAGRMPIETGSATQGGLNALQRAALTALAERDPLLAMRHVEPMLPGLNINVVAQGIVSRFAQSDPDAALAWLDSLEMTTSSHGRVVLDGISSVDFDRAFDLALAGPTDQAFIDSALARGALRDPVRAAEVATKLLNDGSSLASQVLEQLAASWVRRDPEKFTDWLLEHSAVVEPQLAGSVASQFATSDIKSAIALIDRLPPNLRGTWISQVAGPYASQDPKAALDWVQQFEGQPFYEATHSQVVVQIAQADPELAATMLPGLSPALQSTAAPRIARAMAVRDPGAAAEWALGLTDSSAAEGAVTNVVSGWIRSDPASARSWVLGLERGAIRDGALSALVSGSYGTNLDPRPILEEIESDAIRRIATRNAVSRSGNQPDIARELLMTLLDDPEYEGWAREGLERIEASGN